MTQAPRSRETSRSQRSWTACKGFFSKQENIHREHTQKQSHGSRHILTKRKGKERLDYGIRVPKNFQWHEITHVFCVCMREGRKKQDETRGVKKTRMDVVVVVVEYVFFRQTDRHAHIIIALHTHQKGQSMYFACLLARLLPCQSAEPSLHPMMTTQSKFYYSS